jgi:hypothetical protein
VAMGVVWWRILFGDTMPTGSDIDVHLDTK